MPLAWFDPRVQVLTLKLNKNTQTYGLSIFIWQGRQDLNLRHLVLETSALPTELHPYDLLRNNNKLPAVRTGMVTHAGDVPLNFTLTLRGPLPPSP